MHSSPSFPPYCHPCFSPLLLHSLLPVSVPYPNHSSFSLFSLLWPGLLELSQAVERRDLIHLTLGLHQAHHHALRPPPPSQYIAPDKK